MVDLESWGARFENLTKLFFRRGCIITPFSETVHKIFSKVSHIFFTTFQTSEPLCAVSIKWTNGKSEYDSTILPGFWISDYFQTAHRTPSHSENSELK